MAVSFDDLIPEQKTGLTFDDLTPSFGDRLQSPTAPLIPSPTSDQGGFLPFRRGASGRPEFDYSAGVLGSLLRALTTPGDIWRGTVPTPYAPGAGSEVSPDVVSRAMETASVISPASPSYRAGVRYGTPPSPPAAPSTKQIADAADAQFTAVRRSGWELPSSEVENMARGTQRQLGIDFTPADAPRTYARLDEMTNPTYSSTSMPDLLSHYNSLSNVISKGGADAKAAYIARERVAEMINNLNAYGARPAVGATPTMTPGEVASTLETARANTRAAQGSNRISGNLDEAVKGILNEVELGQNVRGMGYNVDLQLRNRAAAILKDNANVASLLPSEREALEAVANGTITRNAVRNFGEIFGLANPLRAPLSAAFGGGLGAAGGGFTGGGIGAFALPALGTAARITGSGMTRHALTAVEELMRRNSPLAQSMIENGPIIPPLPVGREELITRTLFPGLLAPPSEPRRERKLPPGFI